MTMAASMICSRGARLARVLFLTCPPRPEEQRSKFAHCARAFASLGPLYKCRLGSARCALVEPSLLG